MYDFWAVLFTLLIVIDPMGLVPLFISATAGLSPELRARATKTATIAAFGVLCFFIAVGKYLLTFLGISPGAFFVAGGIMLFLSALGMMMGQAQRTKQGKDEEGGIEEARSVAIFPLAIPLISGPGAITSIMIYMSSAKDPLLMGAWLVGAVAAAVALCYLSMRASGAILRIVGKTGVSVVERVMGLLLSGLAVQFVYEGLLRLGAFK
jgi:multiple antibiotic resistance protein